ncbi:MAG: MltA domain-containing protein [Parvibaculum sp.]|nr:MltA domain-containing protein [Parvibaculum sp.]
MVGPKETLSFNELEGWSDDSQTLALGAFKRSCARILKLNPDAPLDKKNDNALYGRAGDWFEACRAVGSVSSNDGAARDYFETYFVPVRFSADEAGLFTGYYEPEMEGSLSRKGKFKTPILSFPADFSSAQASGRTLPTRAEIEDDIKSGEIDADRSAVVWLADPVDAFFLHVQGSGRVSLDNGETLRVGFAAKNQRPYTSIGKLLIEKGAIPRDEVSMQTIRAWLAAHPAEVEPLLLQNDSYIFFKVIQADDHLGPPGAEGVSLTPQRSLAVDRSIHPTGSLFWLETTSPVPHSEGVEPFRHLVVAQDTGTAIRGVQRGDVFWGPGRDAAEIAGRMKQPGRLIALLPRALAP